MKPVSGNAKFNLLLLLIIVVNATGLFNSVMETDGALYACIAKQMAQHNDFINLYNNTDWLDKPHFPFWITALSFKIIGINSFAYKFPVFLFWLLGLFYLYQLGKRIYNRQAAQRLLSLFFRCRNSSCLITLSSCSHILLCSVQITWSAGKNQKAFVLSSWYSVYC